MPHETSGDRVESPLRGQPEEGITRRSFLGLSGKAAAGAFLAGLVPGTVAGSRYLTPKLRECSEPETKTPTEIPDTFIEPAEPMEDVRHAIYHPPEIEGNEALNVLYRQDIRGDDMFFAEAVLKSEYTDEVVRAAMEFNHDPWDIWVSLAKVLKESSLQHYGSNGKVKARNGTDFGLSAVKEGAIMDVYSSKNSEIRRVFGEKLEMGFQSFKDLAINDPETNALVGEAYEVVLSDRYPDMTRSDILGMYKSGPTNHGIDPTDGNRYAKHTYQIAGVLKEGSVHLAQEYPGFREFLDNYGMLEPGYKSIAL
jgi:hypothetical protein